MRPTTRWRDQGAWLASALQARALGALGGALRQVMGGPPSQDAPLTQGERAALVAILGRVAPGDGEGLPPAEAVGALDVVARHVGRLPAQAQRQVRDLLLVFERFGACAVGRAVRFSAAAPDLQDAILGAWARSPLPPMRAAFHALKTMCMLGYWSRPATWAAIGYEGPRPPLPNP